MGLFGRRPRLGLAPLTPCPAVGDLPSPRLSGGARYLGTWTADGVPVRDRGLGGAGQCRLSLSDQGLDVVRLAGPFRVPVTALDGARHEPDSMTVRWTHDGHALETGLRLQPPPKEHPDAEALHRPWVRLLARMARA